jgi:hypothetical protein
MDWAKQIGSAREIFQCQFKKDFLSGLILGKLRADCCAVSGAVLNGLIENSGIGGEAC